MGRGRGVGHGGSVAGRPRDSDRRRGDTWTHDDRPHPKPGPVDEFHIREGGRRRLRRVVKLTSACRRRRRRVVARHLVVPGAVLEFQPVGRTRTAPAVERDDPVRRHRGRHRCRCCRVRPRAIGIDRRDLEVVGRPVAQASRVAANEHRHRDRSRPAAASGIGEPGARRRRDLHPVAGDRRPAGRHRRNPRNEHLRIPRRARSSRRRPRHGSPGRHRP